MKKSTLFLSAAITTFILVVLAGVIFRARANAVAAAAPTPAPTATLAPAATPTETATETLAPTNTLALTPTQVIISPQEAVFIASSALGNTQVYSVDTVTRYGVDVYQVNFSSGHIVFVSPEGHILMITMLQPVAVTADQQASTDNNSPAPAKKKPANDGGGGGDGSGGGDD
jgi:hypothetical protein